MKQLFILAVLFQLLTAKLFAQPTFVNYQMGGLNSAAFTTNNFKCIAVGKDNRIWAGTQYGGLYTYDDNGANIWLKSDKLTNVFINDIKADADSGIWIAQSGQATVGGNSNIAGGINYFAVASDVSMRFFSVVGTTTSADLISRNVRSLYVDQSFRAANGRLPRVWAAQGTYITSFNTRRGGLHIGLNESTPYFTINNSGYQLGPTATPISEAVGGNSTEVWVAVRQNNGGSQILRYRPSGGDTIGKYTNSNVPMLTAGFAAQAIHFDKDGNRWIGLKAGGLIIKTPTDWLKMDAGSLLPAGTQVNFNAITSDEYGNVYIGTSNGLLEYESRDYNPLSSPDYVPSYTLYTTNDGLPGNNITGVAYDAKNGRVLITSDAGVTFMNKRPRFIEGVVFDVYCDLDNTTTQRPGLQKSYLSSGVTVTLLRDNVEEETTTPNAFGIFQLREANDVDTYSVEIRFVKDGQTMVQRFDNIRNRTRMKPVLMPDSLIRELKAFKPKMEKRCFPTKLGFQIPYNVCKDGFNVSGYDNAYQQFYGTPITTDHQKRVYNLANYYTTLAAVYNLGGNVTDLSADMVSNLLDIVDFFVSEALFAEKAGDPATAPTGHHDAFEQAGANAGAEALKLGVNILKTTKTCFAEGSKKVSSILKPYPDVQKIFDMSTACINDAADLLIQYLEQGGKGFAYKAIVDNLKKVLASEISGAIYSKYFAQELHKNLVPETSQSAANNESPLSYDEVFDLVYNSKSNSLVKYGQDTLTSRKASIESLRVIGVVAETSSQVFDAAALLGLLPGGQAIGAISKALSYASKGVKVLTHVGSVYQGAVGAVEEVDLSALVVEKAGLERPLPGGGISPQVLAIPAPDSLIAKKTRYNQRLTELQSQYAGTYNAAAYGNALIRLSFEDSVYTKEMTAALNTLWSTTDSALIAIPGFTARLNRVVDSFIVQQYSLRNSLYFMDVGFVNDSDKSSYRPGLDSLVTEIKRLNDSAVNGIASLITQVNTNNIPSVAYLAQESHSVNHARVPGTSGSVTYIFKNHGSVAQNNVSFKISKPTSGYIITSADSINVGNINPGETKQITYTFTAPLHDSVSHYEITIKANNGIYKNVYGALFAIDQAKFYTIRNGDWNSPSTWHNNQVPGATNKVQISHNVTVTTDVTCKSVTVSKPGNVIVNTGRRIIINN